jgi:hypothetical protein
MRAGLAVALLAATALLGCESKPRAAMGHPCVVDGDCETALACRQQRCALRQDIVASVITENRPLLIT